jgi:hypothetical protein
MDSSKIKAIIIATLALTFSVYLGIAAATAQLEVAAWVGGGLFVAVCFSLGRHVWVLIPIFLICEGVINALPGSPDPWTLAGFVVAGMYVIRFLTRREGFVFRWSILDFAILLHFACICQAWVRNPTGLSIFGGDTVGGKTYLIFTVAVVTYACLSITLPTVKAIKYATILRIGVGLLDGVVILLQDYSPKFGQLGLRTYIGPDYSGFTRLENVQIDESRLVGAKFLGLNLVTPAFCLTRPLHCLLPAFIIPFAATMVGSALVLLSGFRSTVGYLVVLFLTAVIVRKKPIDAVIAGAFGIILLVLVAGSGQVDKLPFGVQRIFTVIGATGKSEQVMRSAEDSSNDRFLVWRLVLTQEGYIKNKWLGDGFSLTQDEMNALANNRLGFKSVAFIERCLTTGNYHGFHVSTIRYIGVIGLLSAIFAMAVFIATSLKLIKYYRNTELFPYVLYICLPIMLYLPWSLLVFGAYSTEFPKILVMGGVLKLLDNFRLSQLVENRLAIAGSTAK